MKALKVERWNSRFALEEMYVSDDDVTRTGGNVVLGCRGFTYVFFFFFFLGTYFKDTVYSVHKEKPQIRFPNQFK